MLQTAGSFNSANLNTINEQATSAANTASAMADAAQLAMDEREKRSGVIFAGIYALWITSAK